MTKEVEKPVGNMVAVDLSSRIIFCMGNWDKKIAARSTAKLIQVLPVYLLGLDKKFGLDSAELTIMSSSHLAQEQQVRVLERLLKKTGIREEEIRLNTAAPAGKIACELWRKKHIPKRKLYHPCAGNHIGIMLAQRELTGRTVRYEIQDSPVQQWILELVSVFSEYPKGSIGLTPDGCGIPSFILPMKNLAVMYKNMMYEGNVLLPAVQKSILYHKRAIWKNPCMLEGDGCLSTVVSSHKNLIAKTGAGGLLAAGVGKDMYGVLIQSDQENWSTIASMLDCFLRHIGYMDGELSRELRQF